MKTLFNTRTFGRVLLTLALLAALIAGSGWIGALRAQNTGAAPAAEPVPRAAPPADAPPAQTPRPQAPATQAPPADVEVAPGDRISADNNVTFPVDI